MNNTNNIDIVIPWVDGSDKRWQKKASKYVKNFDGERYRDWDTLRYVFRSIEKYCSWVHKVYLITDDQKPEWLNENYDKVEVVDHKQIISKEYLPTFNSSVIAMNEHKIPGLSEKFINVNDEFIFSAPIKPTDFFKNDLPCDFMIESPVIGRIAWHKMIFNEVVLINQKFRKKKFIINSFNKYFSIHYGWYNFTTLLSLPNRMYAGFYSDHGPQPYLKSSFDEVWNLYPETIQQTCTHRTRDERDVTEWLVRYYQLASGKFCPRKVRNRTMYYSVGANNFNEIDKALRKQKYQAIILNDDDVVKVDDFNTTFKGIHEVLERNFPQKSKFEK